MEKQLFFMFFKQSTLSSGWFLFLVLKCDLRTLSFKIYEDGQKQGKKVTSAKIIFNIQKYAAWCIFFFTSLWAPTFYFNLKI